MGKRRMSEADHKSAVGHAMADAWQAHAEELQKRIDTAKRVIEMARESDGYGPGLAEVQDALDGDVVLIDEVLVDFGGQAR